MSTEHARTLTAVHPWPHGHMQRQSDGGLWRYRYRRRLMDWQYWIITGMHKVVLACPATGKLAGPVKAWLLVRYRTYANETNELWHEGETDLDYSRQYVAISCDQCAGVHYYVKP